MDDSRDPNKYSRFDQIDWSNWIPQQRATLVFVIKDGQILLIHKKRGLGAGKINGPGGRIDPGEPALAGAIREVEEELCVTPTGLKKHGDLSFQFTDGFSIHCEVFTASDCVGVPQETDEATPLWTRIEEIPYEKMWVDDRIWLPLMLEEKTFAGRFLFEGDELLGYELETV